MKEKIYSVWDTVFYNEKLKTWTIISHLPLSYLKPKKWVIIKVESYKSNMFSWCTYYRYTVSENKYFPDENIHTVFNSIEWYLDYVTSAMERIILDKSSSYFWKLRRIVWDYFLSSRIRFP